MSCLSEILAPLSHLAPSLQAPALTVTVGFTVALVAWLVAVEETELRRGRASAGESAG